jgi:hypothetical protein
MATIRELQSAVGPCPICGRTIDWFNDVPLKAYCWGVMDDEHTGVVRIVPSPVQPYGEVSERTRWVKERVLGGK